MGKKRTVTVELPDSHESEPEKTAAERAAEYSRETQGLDEDDAEELFKGLDELRSVQGVVFQVYRVEPTEKSGFCTEYPAALFSQLRLTRDYGPGVYRIRVKAGGRYVPGGGTLRIAETVGPQDPRLDGKTGEEKSSVHDLLEILKADREKSSEKMLQWTTALAPLLAPVLANFVSGKSQVTELVAALGSLKSLTPEPEKPPDFNSQLENIAQLMGKLKELAGEEKTSTGATWIDLIRDAVSGVKPILETVAARVAGPPPSPQGIPIMAPVALPGPAPVPVSVPSNGGAVLASNGDKAVPSERPAGVISLLPWLSQTLQQLIQQAAHNRDPELYAEVTLDNLPDGTDPKELIPFLERADWWEQLKAFVPAVAPYPAWFADYRAAVLEMLKGAPVTTSEASPAGDAAPPPMTEPDPGDGM